jgi:two-component system OmpR family response regulator
MLPSLDGPVDRAGAARRRRSHARIDTERDSGEVDDRVLGLRAGGDDYLTKPFAFSELLARIEALQRRASRPTADDVAARRRSGDGPAHALGEARRSAHRPAAARVPLLEYLMRHSGQVVTRTMLLEGVWDYHFDPQTNVIDVHISRLRAKIDRGFDKPLLHTVRGAGYKLHETA